MKWIKHYHNASTSNKLNELIDEFGIEGYGRYWLLLELLSEKFDGENEVIRIHFREISAKVHIKFSKKLGTFLQKLADFSLLSYELSGNFYEFTAPILLNLQAKDFKYDRSNRKASDPKKKEERIKKKDKRITVLAEKPASGVIKKIPVKPSFEVRCAYEKAFENRYQIKPSWGAPEYTMANRIMKSMPKAELIELVSDYLNYNDPWHVKQKHPFKLFATQLDKIRVEILDPKRMLDDRILNKQLNEVVDLSEQEQARKKLEKLRFEAEGGVNERQSISISS